MHVANENGSACGFGSIGEDGLLKFVRLLFAVMAAIVSVIISAMVVTATTGICAVIGRVANPLAIAATGEGFAISVNA